MATAKLGSKAVGSIVKIKVNGTLQEFIVVHQGIPSNIYDKSCDGTWLLMNDIYENRKWSSSKSNDYRNSSINNYLNDTFLNLIDSDIRNIIRQVKIPYRHGKGSDREVNVGADGLSVKIFLLSACEVGLVASDSSKYPADGSRLSYFVKGEGSTAIKKRIAYYQGEACTWFLRSPWIHEAMPNTAPISIMSGGDWGAPDPDYPRGNRPAFILPPTLWVTDSGSVSENTAPQPPLDINIPDYIIGGEKITISWDASVDAEENLDGYIVERSTDGGSSWAQIYQGPECSTTNAIAFGTTNVVYRVKAYDSEGLQSNWRTSAQISVINNHAPSAPSGLIVPEAVVCNEQLPITWGQSTDIDGDPIGYILERQTDGGAWNKLYEGTEQTFTDSIVKGWKTVAYRVKAYDSYNAFSAYITSETRAVNNNTAPSISGEDTALGMKTGSFSQAYTVSDAENNTVTVTEYVDNQVIRSYQAVLGQDTAITISRENWMKLTNGNHQLRVTAYDGVATTARIWTFSKKETVICFQLAAPMETEAAAVKILVSPTWKIDGAAVRVEACNNAFDEAPAWEDITAMLMLKRVYHFTNAAKTADKWGLDIRFTIEKNEGYEGEVSITGFGVAYE